VKHACNKFYLSKVGLRQSGSPLLHNDCIFLLVALLLISFLSVNSTPSSFGP
jgi:hypothetical protein